MLFSRQQQCGSNHTSGRHLQLPATKKEIKPSLLGVPRLPSTARRSLSWVRSLSIGVVLGILLTRQHKVLFFMSIDSRNRIDGDSSFDTTANPRLPAAVRELQPQLSDGGIATANNRTIASLTTLAHNYGQPHDHSDLSDPGQKSDELQLAWLQSFPNSGTSYTLRLVQRLSHTRTALNYGLEEQQAGRPLDSVFSDDSGHYLNEQGPFWAHFDDEAMKQAATTLGETSTAMADYQLPTRYALTKTHCGGRCVSCYSIYYLQSMSSFREACVTTTYQQQHSYNNHSNDDTDNHNETAKDHSPNKNGEKQGTYSINRVGKAVHLFRNPLDNIVSRYHNYRFNEKLPGPGTREDFRKYCEQVNAKTEATDRRYSVWQQPIPIASMLQTSNASTTATSTTLWDLLHAVPCRADFFKYTQWHNLAWATTMEYNIDTMPLYYEDFSDAWEATAAGLLAFLELSPLSQTQTQSQQSQQNSANQQQQRHRQGGIPFVPGKSYADYFSAEEQARIAWAIRSLATRTTWRSLERYFPEMRATHAAAAAES